VRRFLPLLVDTLEFEATDAGEHITEALKVLQAAEHKHSLTPADVEMRIVFARWRRCATVFTAVTCS
jgi:hypothetical protein